MDGPEFQKSCCSLDLETNERGEMFAIGALLQGKTFHRTAPFNICQILAEFDH